MGVTSGFDEAIGDMHDLAENAGDVGPLMGEIATGAASEMRKNLVEERSQGHPMKRLSPAYAARKAKRYPGKTILRATDQLLGSVVSDSGANFAEAGPTDPKAEYHGAARDPRRLRDPFYVSKASTDAAEKALVEFLGPNR